MAINDPGQRRAFRTATDPGALLLLKSSDGQRVDRRQGATTARKETEMTAQDLLTSLFSTSRLAAPAC
ncbi:MAG: hypothetical protein RI601_11165 [Desulfurivibrionaceae bacterium]|nr:hypothetical protein [Desulfurivibrionaceae bacterium]